MAGSNLGIGLGERGLSLFPSRPGVEDVHVVTGLTPNLTDATTREANRAAIANALATVGAAGGGVILIPAGHYYLQQPNININGYAIDIDQDNITLRGQGIGKTVLHTRSDWTVQGGAVIRGNGIRIRGTSSASAPRRDITLENFELDGGAGHTGNYGWPANTTTGDGWDITHKGLILSVDDYVDGVTIRDVYVHRYRGEIIYVGGGLMGSLRLERVWAADGNAQALNTFAADMTVSDCQFGGPNSFWQEWAQTTTPSAATYLVENSTFYQNLHDTGGVGVSDMQGTQVATWRNNRFIDGWGVFGIYGGVGSGVTMNIEDNYIEGMSVAAVYMSNHVNPGAVNNINFTGNRIIDSNSMVTTYQGGKTSHLYDSNDFEGTGGNTMFFYQGSGWTDVTVSNNVYRNTGSEFRNNGGNTGNPVFLNNTARGAVQDTQAPSTPTGLTALVGSPLGSSHRVWLNWNASTDNVGVSGYRVYRDGVEIGVARHRWYMDTGLDPATEYTFTVSAFDFAGNESGESLAVKATTL